MSKLENLENALAALTVPTSNLYSKVKDGQIKDKRNENEIRALYFCVQQTVQILHEFKLED